MKTILKRLLAPVVLLLICAGMGAGIHGSESLGDIDFPLRDPTDDCHACCDVQIAAFNSCINKAQFYYDLAYSDWPNVSNKNRSYCIQLMNKSVPRAFYEGLETCLNERLREQANETPREFHY